MADPSSRGFVVIARRMLSALAFVALAPGTAAAQFTTFVAPVRRDSVALADSNVIVAAAPSADSVARANIANMKSWVDSAAGPGIDLGAATSSPATPGTTTTTSNGAMGAFPDGAPAPDTATPLPLLLTLGVGALGAGAALLRRR